MKKTSESIDERELRKVLEPRLLGRVFHVTCHYVANSTLSGEPLLPNPDNKLKSGFGYSSKSPFREGGYISFFDFRNPTNDDLETAYYWAGCLNPNGTAKNNPAFLFLNPSYFQFLVPYNLLHKKQGYTQVVPNVEVGYKGEVPSKMLDEIVFVTVNPAPKTKLELIVEESYKLENSKLVL